MRVYIDLDENIDNISELYAYIKTRDDKHIRVGGDFKLWATEKIGRDISEIEKQEPCEDAISRKEAIEWIENIRELNRYYHPKENNDKALVSEVIDRLKQVPSVSTEKTGRWITHCYQNCKCSMCGYVISEYDSEEFKFCPNCRAKMAESEDREDDN